MNTEAIEILNAICEKIGVAIDWTGESVMPQLESLIEQYARYLLVSNIVCLIISVLAVIFGVWLLVKEEKSFRAKTWARDNDFTCIDTRSGVGFACLVVAVCCIIIGGVLTIFGIDALIKSITIPQIYAAERLLSMIQQ